MHITILAFLFLALAGCVGSPPKPPEVKGEYRPINRIEPKQIATHYGRLTQQTFDFYYEGDIVESLHALHNVQPQLIVLPPLGKRISLPVRVNLQATTLADALKAIGEQGGRFADVVLNTSTQGGNQAFVRFHSTYDQPAAK
jgi:hypothetical protein